MRRPVYPVMLWVFNTNSFLGLQIDRSDRDEGREKWWCRSRDDYYWFINDSMIQSLLISNYWSSNIQYCPFTKYQPPAKGIQSRNRGKCDIWILSEILAPKIYFSFVATVQTDAKTASFGIVRARKNFSPFGTKVDISVVRKSIFTLRYMLGLSLINIVRCPSYKKTQFHINISSTCNIVAIYG